MAVAISLGGASARLVTDEWHEENGEDNDAAREYLNSLETLLGDTDSDAQYMGELWDGADPEGEESFRPIYYAEGDIRAAHNMRQAAAHHVAQPLAASK